MKIDKDLLEEIWKNKDIVRDIGKVFHVLRVLNKDNRNYEKLSDEELGFFGLPKDCELVNVLESYKTYLLKDIPQVFEVNIDKKGFVEYNKNKSKDSL